jgi:hypothetical protein
MAARYDLDHFDARTRGDLFLQVSTGATIGALTALMRDAPDQASAHVAFAAAHWSNKRYSQQHIYTLIGSAHLDLYRGDARKAWQDIRSAWHRISSSRLFDVWWTHVVIMDLRGRAALAAAGASPEAEQRRECLADAQRCARWLCRQPGDWPRTLGYLLHAGVAHGRGAHEKACPHAARARLCATRNGQRLHAQLAALLETRCSQPSVTAAKEAEEYLRREGVTRPERFAALFAPALGWTVRWSSSETRDATT